MKINRIIIVSLLLCVLTSCLASCNSTQEDANTQFGGTTSSKRSTNYQYEKVYSQSDFESFLRGENPDLIAGCPELLYDDTILLGYFQSNRFFQTENAYYLQASQHPQKEVIYRFEQVGDVITGYIKYDFVRS